jgi:oligopeptide transport system substrate-binding protein
MNHSTKRNGARVFTALALALFSHFLFAAEIRRGLGPEPDSLHIHQAQGLVAVNLLREIREGLVTFDEHGELIPGQAASWLELDGGRRYRFMLRPDARWSNGDPVTSEDFVRAWRRAFTLETMATTAGLLKDVRNAEEILKGEKTADTLGIVAVEPGVLDILLDEPAPWILEILAHPVSFPLHADEGGDPQHAPVNGAYLITDWTPRASLKLVRNPAYYAAESVQAETIEYFPIEEAAAELSRYRAGELDITETIPPGRFAWLQENLASDLRVYPYLGSFWLGFNFHHPALGFSNDLRTALSLAVNREILVRTVLGPANYPHGASCRRVSAATSRRS